MGDTPCRYCTEKRHPGCHGECNDYAKWKAKENMKHEIVTKNKNAYYAPYDVKQESILKNIRSHR